MLTSEQKILSKTRIGSLLVSTVFLGIDHGFDPDPNALPVLWETMVFAVRGDGEVDYTDLYCNRYTSREDALGGHENVVAQLKRGVAAEDLV